MAYRNLVDRQGAFNVYEKPKKKEPISTVDEYQEAFLKSLEAYELRQRKPVRWNFLKDNEGMFQVSRAISPMMKMNERLYRIITKAMGDEKPFWTELKAKESRLKSKERDYIEGFDEIAKGIETGKHELGTSLGELLFMGTDILANTNFQSDFQKMMDKQKPDEPETWRGDLAALMVTYGAPGTVIFKIAQRAKFLQPVVDALAKTKLHKASKIAQRMATNAIALGATDALVSPDQRRLPTIFKFAKPKDVSHLKGRKRAAAMLMNRVRYGVEGSIVGGVFPLAGKAFQQTYKYAGRPVGEPMLSMGFNVAGAGFKGASYLLAKNPALHSEVARSLVGSTKYGIKKMISPITNKIGPKGLPPFEEWSLLQTTKERPFTERAKKHIDNVLSWLRSYGKLPKAIQGVSEEVELFIKNSARKLDKHLKSIDKRAYNLAKKYEQRHKTNNTSRPYEKMLKDDIVDYLQGTVKLGQVHKDLRPFAYEIKKDINKILTTFGKNLPRGTKSEVIEDLRKTFTKKIDNYLVRSFATFRILNTLHSKL